MGFSRQEYWSDLPLPSPVDQNPPPWPVRLGWRYMAWLSFTELDKAVVLSLYWHLLEKWCLCFLICADGKESSCKHRRPRFDPWMGKIPWRREWQPTLVLLPGEFHGQSSLVGDSLWNSKKSFTTEQLTFLYFPSRKQCPWISWLQSSSTVILELRKTKSVTVSTFPPSICHEVIRLDATILVFECWILKQLFQSPLPPSSTGFLVPLHFLPLEWYSLHIWGCWYFSQQSLFQPGISRDILCIHVKWAGWQ